MAGLLLKLSLYSSVLNIFFTPLSQSLARIFGYITIILFFTSAILTAFHGRKMIIDKYVCYILLAILLSFVVNIFSIQFTSLEELVDKCVMLLSFVAFYILLSTKQNENNVFVLEDVFRINYVLCIIFLVFAFGPFEFKYELVNKYGKMLFTMGLGNPNGTSLCIMFVIILLLIQFDSLNKRYTKAINVIATVLMLYILFLLSSRTVVFCALMITIAFLLRSHKIFKWISFFVILVPVVMIVWQISLINVNDLTVEILGKAIDTGRPEIYIEVLRDIFDSPIEVIIGNVYKHTFYNYHNGILTILASIGSIGLLLYIKFWNKQLSLLRTICVKRNQKIAFVAILAILVHATSESMGVVGTIPYSIFIVIIMKIARGEIRSRYDRFAEDRI